MYYLACQVCKRKVFQVGEQFRCENCDKFFNDVVPTFNFRIMVSDCSDTINISCFGESGESILGMTGAKFYTDYS